MYICIFFYVYMYTHGLGGRICDFSNSIYTAEKRVCTSISIYVYMEIYINIYVKIYACYCFTQTTFRQKYEFKSVFVNIHVAFF